MMIPEKVKAVLDSRGLKALEFEPGSTPTAVMAAQKIGCQVGQIVKSLLFKDKRGGLHLILCSGDARVSSKKLKAYAGTDTSMATSDETYNATGFRPGGVCPFGVVGIPMYLDETLNRWPVIFPAAGTDATGVPMTYKQLLEITRAKECDIIQEIKPL